VTNIFPRNIRRIRRSKSGLVRLPVRQTLDADTGEEVSNDDIVKGYMLDKDQFVEVTNG
jgi:non-homologous end joining protein Ku